MFRFSLESKNQNFQLTPATTGTRKFHGGEGGVVRSRNENWSTVEIRWEDDEITNLEFRRFMREVMLLYLASVERGVMIEIGIGQTVDLSQKPLDYIAVVGRNKWNFLERLPKFVGAQGWEFKMRVEIKDFGSEGGDKVNVWTSEEGIGKLSGYFGGEVGFESQCLKYSGVFQRELWDQTHVFSGRITVSCVAFRVEDSFPEMVEAFPGSGPMPSRILQKMLEEGVLSDSTIISAEGEAIKCHKFILTGQSDVFDAMFKDTSESAEALTGNVTLDDMCSKSVKALLAYLYLEDIGKVVDDSGVALDLLMAGHKYSRSWL